MGNFLMLFNYWALKIGKFFLYLLGIIFLIVSFGILSDGSGFILFLSMFLFSILIFPLVFSFLKDVFLKIIPNKIKLFNLYYPVFVFFGIIITLILFGNNSFESKKELEKNTVLDVEYSINKNYTSQDNLKINIKYENIKEISLNNDNLDIISGSGSYSYDFLLENGFNEIRLIGINGDIKKRSSKGIEKVTVEEELKRDEEIELKKELELEIQKERIKKENNIRIEKERTERIEKQFSPWDGSHYSLTRILKKYLKDPDSYEHIETIYYDKKDFILVITEYRAKNSFGGYVINTISAKFKINGDLIEVLDN